MAYVYMLLTTSGKYYIGATTDLEQRLIYHNSGKVPSTKRLGLPVRLVASKSYSSFQEATQIEQKLKRWKAPKKALLFLTS